MMAIETKIGTDIKYSVQLLTKGKLVAIPTETVYGLAANAFDKLAVARIFEAKQRPKFDPLIVHIANIAQVNELALRFPEKAKKLVKKFWPGPLTLILPKSDKIPEIVSAGLNTVGIRMPAHPLTLELLQQLDFPLAAPSANPFGYISPTSAQHVFHQLQGKIEYILDGGPCEVGVESTIVSFAERQPTVLRMGGISIEEIENEIGKVAVNTKSESNPTAPGMLLSHYAPATKFILGDIQQEILKQQPKNYAVLGFQTTYGHAGKVLSKTGNLAEAAHNLFSHLRDLDRAGYEIIFAEELPEKGLGRAINDRLRRAARG